MARISSGAAAGIGIACTIAGAIIVMSIIYFIGYRRRRLARSGNRSVGGEDGHVEAYLHPEKGANDHGQIRSPEALAPRAVPPVPPPQASSQRTSESSLESWGQEERTAADQEVRQTFHALNVAIQKHAEMYYHTTSLLSDDNIQSCDAKLPTLTELLGPGAPVDATAMHSLLQNPDTRADAIRLLIAWIITKYIQPDALSDRTLLPPELIQCAQAMARSATVEVVEEARQPVHATEVRRKSLPFAHVFNAPATRNASPPTAEDDREAFAKWRETSGRLFAPIYGDGSVKPGDAREGNIGELVTVLVCLLQPYTAKGYGGARVRDLESVIKGGAAFGYKLFTQRAEWEFAWSTLMADELVVYPALVKIGDEKGRKLRQSMVLSWEETVKVTEPVDNLRASAHCGIAL